VSGAWPWWLTPLGEHLQEARCRRWEAPDEIAKKAVLARDNKRHYQAARLDARRARAQPGQPQSPTWSADRFAEARQRIREQAGLDAAAYWGRLLLVVPDAAKSALAGARDAYDAACEAIAWSVAVTVLGLWWWPALPAGLLLWAVACRWLRRSVIALCDTATWAFTRYGSELAADEQPRPARHPQP
jgi:hypothetical protein